MREGSMKMFGRKKMDTESGMTFYGAATVSELELDAEVPMSTAR